MANKDKGGSKSSKTAASKTLEGETSREEGKGGRFGFPLVGKLDQPVAA